MHKNYIILFVTIILLSGCARGIYKDMPYEYYMYGHCLDKAIYLAEHSSSLAVIDIGYSNMGVLHAEAVHAGMMHIKGKRWAIDGKQCY